MVKIVIQKDETCFEDHITIHSKNCEHPGSLIEAPNVEILLTFEDGRIKSISSSNPKPSQE